MDQVTLSLKAYEVLKSQADGKNTELEKRIEELLYKIEDLKKNNENLISATPHIEVHTIPGNHGIGATIIRQFMGIDEIKAVWEKEHSSEIKKVKDEHASCIKGLEKELLEKNILIQDLEADVKFFEKERDKWINISDSKKSLFQRIFGS